jgi:hypothetical protein
MRCVPFVLAFGLALGLAGCGGDGGGSSDGPHVGPHAVGGGGDGGGSADLKALESTPPSQAPTLTAAYGVEDGGEAGFVAFYSGQRYFSGVVQRLSAVRYRAAGVLGHYEQQGDAIVTHKQRTTCQYLSQKYDGKSHAYGTIGDASITVQSETTTLVLARVAASTAAPKNGLVIEWGCFDEQTGEFTPEGWSDVP